MSRLFAVVLLLGCLPVQAAVHGEDWCATAVDFAMGAAQNRELGYTQEMITVSLERRPDHYERQFAGLTAVEMKKIVEEAYAKQWTRFGAAQAITESCIPQ